jgi:hypothetical protein
MMMMTMMIMTETTSWCVKRTITVINSIENTSKESAVAQVTAFNSLTI